MPPRFNYQQRSPEQLSKRASGNMFEGFILDTFETFSPKAGENHIRICPPTWQDPQHYGMDIWVHYSVGPNNGSVLCLWKMGGSACPICEAQARAEAAGREDARELKPTRRVLAWIIDRNFEKEKQQKKCFAWAMPATKVDTEIAIICKDRETGQLFYIDNPDEGYDIFFQKTGEKLNTDYKGFTLSRRPSSIDQYYLDFVAANPIPNVLKWRTYEEVKAMFEGQPVSAVQVATPNGQIQEMVPPVTAPTPFIPEWTGEHCSLCSQPQYTTQNGVTCQGAHPNAISIEEEQRQAPPPAPPPVVEAPPPPPVQVAPPPAPAPVQQAPAPAPVAPRPVIHGPGTVAAPATPAAPSQPAAPAPASRVAGLRNRFTS